MEYKHIHILEERVARQIAAGEVIDRPSAVLRELIDNSVDSGADSIEILIQGAGLDLIQVSDNGIGIKKEDLERSCLPHATSKIVSSEDLSHILSMGFRGEALPSIAAVSQLGIVSKNEEDEHAWKIDATHTEVSNPEKASRNAGTTVSVSRLFQDIPARRKFLSSPQSELNQLKQMFFKKAACLPHVQFSFQSEHINSIKPKETPLSRSICLFSSQLVSEDFIYAERQEIIYEDKCYAFSAALGLPYLAKRTRKDIHIYINRRPVKEFAILQAVEYSYRHVLHGNKFPMAVIFLEIPPSELDVNIHPAKSEVKIKGIEIVRELVKRRIEEVLSSLSVATPHIIPDAHAHITRLNSSSSEQHFPENKLEIEQKNKTANTIDKPKTYSHTSKNSFGSSVNADKHKDTKYASMSSMPLELFEEHDSQVSDESVPHKTGESPHEGWKFKTSVFDTYLIFEHSEQELLMLMDFHAAHEKIIYDILCALDTKKRTLLIPVSLMLDMDEKSVVVLIREYAKLGIDIEKKEDEYYLVSIPANAPLDADSIAKLIEETENPYSISAEMFASRACRKAAKAGDHVDSKGAYDILEQVMSMDIQRCPHGRPLYLNLLKKELDKLIGRLE